MKDLVGVALYLIKSSSSTEGASPKYECIPGIMKEEAVDILKRFYEQENPSDKSTS